jgi:hypothetical protein
MNPLTPPAGPYDPPDDEFPDYNGWHRGEMSDPTIKRAHYGRRTRDNPGIAAAVKRVVEPIAPFVDALWKMGLGAAALLLVSMCKIPGRMDSLEEGLRTETRRAMVADSLSLVDRSEMKRSLDRTSALLYRIERQTCAGLDSRRAYEQDCPDAARPR